MRIQVNSEPRELKDGISLPELIAALQLKPQQIAIELNQQVIRRAEWETTTLRDGDKIEIVHFVGGGNQEQETAARGRSTGRRQWQRQKQGER